MTESKEKSWLFLRDLDEKKWTLSCGPAIVSRLHGKMEVGPYLPGILFTFPSSVQAAKAGLQMHSELPRFFGEEGLPPMVIDRSSEPKLLSLFAHGLVNRTILMTDRACRYLAGEPIDLQPGPTIPLETGSEVKTSTVLPSSHNMGWALPSLQVGGEGHPHLRADNPPEIHLELQRPRSIEVLKWIPWKSAIIMAFTALLLILGYRITTQLVAVKSGHPTNSQETSWISSLFSNPGSEGQENPIDQRSAEEKGLKIETPSSPVPLPPGFGDVLIQVDPPDAKVYVNGKFAGEKSPILLSRQSNRGILQLVAKKKGYAPYSKFFNVEADTQTELKVQLKKKGP